MLKSITLKNIQSIPEAVINLPEHGIVRFSGRNGHGKSITEKVVEKSVSGAIRDAKTRKSLISKWASTGELIMETYTGKKIKVRLSIDASSTYVEYTDNKTGNTYRRYLADGKDSIALLFRMFGFHYNADRDVSLNIYKTFGSILFVDTPGVLNYDIISEATTDMHAEKALETEKQFIDEQTRAYKETEQTFTTNQQKKELLQFCDIEAETAIINEYTLLADMIEAFSYVPDIKPLESVPDIRILGITKIPEIPELKSLPNIDSIRILSSVPVIAPIESLTSAKEIKAIEVMSASNLESIASALSIELPSIPAADTIKAIQQIPEAIEIAKVSYSSLKDIDQLLKSIEALSTPIVPPDMKDILIDAGRLKEALDNMICPLCGHSILEDTCKEGDVINE